MTEALAYCLTVACSEADVEAVEGQSFCPACIAKLIREGWKLSPNGNRVNKDTGVKVTAGGTVTVTARYNARMLALMAGEINVDDLDEEELARGMCRGPNGEIPKRQPAMVPKAMYDKMLKALFERSDDLLKESLIAAATSIAKIATDDSVDPGTRLKSATWLFERLRGKTPDVLQVSQEKPYEVLIGKVERGPRPPVASPLGAE
jgi:hypothetical protein